MQIYDHQTRSGNHGFYSIVDQNLVKYTLREAKFREHIYCTRDARHSKSRRKWNEQCSHLMVENGGLLLIRRKSANFVRHFGILGAPRILSRVHRVSTRQARIIGWQYNYPIGRQYNCATAWDYKCVDVHMWKLGNLVQCLRLLVLSIGH